MHHDHLYNEIQTRTLMSSVFFSRTEYIYIDIDIDRYRYR